MNANKNGSKGSLAKGTRDIFHDRPQVANILVWCDTHNSGTVLADHGSSQSELDGAAVSARLEGLVDRVQLRNGKSEFLT